MNQLTVLQQLRILNRYRSKAFVMSLLVTLICLTGFCVWPRAFSFQGKTARTLTANVENKSFEDSKHPVFRQQAEPERLLLTCISIYPEAPRFYEPAQKVCRLLKTLSAGRTESEATFDSVYKNLQTDLVLTKAEQPGLVVRLSPFEPKRAAMESQLFEMNEVGGKAYQPRRDVDIAWQDLELSSVRRGKSKAIPINKPRMAPVFECVCKKIFCQNLFGT